MTCKIKRLSSTMYCLKDFDIWIVIFDKLIDNTNNVILNQYLTNPIRIKAKAVNRRGFDYWDGVDRENSTSSIETIDFITSFSRSITTKQYILDSHQFIYQITSISITDLGNKFMTISGMLKEELTKGYFKLLSEA